MNRVSALVLAALWASVAMPVRAQVAVTETWDDFAIVSSTMGANLGRLCAGADRGDLGCPTYAPSLTTAGDVSVTGNLSAVKFIGDGSGLTGLSTTSDRITSGTSSIIVSNSGHISFTTAGTERMVINSAGNVGIGTATPNASYKLVVNGYLATADYLDIGQANTSNGNLRLWSSAGTASAGLLTASGNTTLYSNGGGGFLTFQTSGGERARIDTSGKVGIGTTSPQATLQVSGSLIVSTTGQTTTPSLYVGTNGNVGVGTAAPSYALDVSGTARAGLVRVDVGAGNANAYLYLIGRNSGAAQQGLIYANQTGGLVYVANSAANATSFHDFLVGPSATSAMRIANSGNVGIGTTSPNKTLAVSGTAEINSRTIVGGTGTPSATLQVSGSLLLAGSDSTTCDDAHLGILRRNPTTGRLQVCK